MNEGDYAIVVGIDDYPLLENGNLVGPELAATEFAKRLVEKCGVPEANLELILGQDSTPDLECVDDAFIEVFKRASASQTAARRLYVFFAGHGLASHPKQLVLLMANATKLLLGRGPRTQDYQNRLEDPFCFFAEQVFVFDCCRQVMKDFHAAGYPPAWTIAPPAAQSVAQGVLFAARHGEFAKTVPIGGGKSQCVLTYALLEGLDGKAAIRHGKGYAITIRSLARYAYWRLEALKLEGIPIEQAPELIGAGVADLVLVEDVATPVANVTVQSANSSDATMVRAYLDGREPTESAVIEGSSASMWLMPGPYTFEATAADGTPCGHTDRVDVPFDAHIDVRLGAANNA
jgi:hypothetical protein